nr:prolyl oligopeptidase family serine peptidase [Amycolatopsis antarctica]
MAMLHGGWWRAEYDLHLMDAICADLAGRGLLVWNIEYRRIEGDGGGWPTTLDDVLSCVSTMPVPAGAPTTAIGHSAGGHLALLAGAHGAVDDVVALAPITDPARCFREGIGGTAPVLFTGGEPDDRPETYRAATPPAKQPAGHRLVVHGDADCSVPVVHSRDYVAAAEPPAEYLEVSGADHFAVIDPAHPLWQRVVSWMDRERG